MGFKQQKHTEKRKWQIIKFEDNVNCGIIAFCDKRSFLTSTGFLLQRKMQKDVQDIRSNLRRELDIDRVKQEEELMALRVSSQCAVQTCTILHPPIVVMISCP
jgi:(p)ppGpp synthase/HD superfamily hydrolase